MRGCEESYKRWLAFDSSRGEWHVIHVPSFSSYKSYPNTIEE
jgi:hypothetical protein